METDKLVSADEAREFSVNGCSDDDTYRLARTVIALRAIIEGRTVAPTIAEAVAHPGKWLLRHVYGKVDVFDGASVAYVPPEVIARVWALDADGTPCPWPVVTP